MARRASLSSSVAKVIRQARDEGLETTGIILQPDGAIEVRTRERGAPTSSQEAVRNEIARHFGSA
ncbi:hypothetical protein BH10PSE5_BH10PSE5_24700 [soil metagenome]